jgi:hypothetical protein
MICPKVIGLWRSERAVRLFEKLGLLQRRVSSEYGVAMRKATKSVDNRPVSFRPFFAIPDRRGLPPVRPRGFATGDPQHVRTADTENSVRPSSGGRQILGRWRPPPPKVPADRRRMRARRVAEHIARHLVKHDHRGKRDLCVSQQGIGQRSFASARHETFVQAEKTLANARVKRRVLLEPLVRLSLLEPKLQNVPDPPISRIIDDCGALQDARINSRCALLSV